VEKQSNRAFCSSQDKTRTVSAWSENRVLELLNDAQTPVEHISALLNCLYLRQSAEEQESGIASHKNGQGFNKVDAEFLSSVARSLADRGGYPTQYKRAPLVE
jgi:hypothetical protein